MKKNNENKKGRNWACVIYPDSAPGNWKEILKLKGLTFACSPKHDKDIDPTGTLKKEHYHVILTYQGPTTFLHVKSLLEELNQPIPIPLESVRGYYRYFTHKDNPDKYQYDESEIELYNGFDVCDIMNSFEVYQSLKQIQSIIIENQIHEYCVLMDLLFSTEQMELWNVACSHTLFLNSYISSKRNKFVNDIKKNA